MKQIQSILTTVIFTTLLLLVSTSASSREQFDTVAGDITAQHRRVVAEQTEQNREIAGKRRQLQQKRDRRLSELAGEERFLSLEQADLEVLVARRDTLRHEIATRLASKEELDNIFMDHIRNFLGLMEHSPFSDRQQDRLQLLNQYLEGKRVFDLKDMTGLLTMYFDDIEAGRQNVRYRGTALDRNGEERPADIIRLGHMGAMFEADGRHGFLTFSSGGNRLVMSGSPGFFTRRALASFFAGTDNETPLDLSGGVAVSRLSRQESLTDRLKSGGILVIPILLVGLAAIVIVVERLHFLSRVRHNTDDLMTRVTDLVLEGDFTRALEVTEPHRNRPTGRVLMSGLASRGLSNEVIESAISEAILNQAPRLERFIGALKVLAAVAPLLGLLGTVTGMINTFQVITIHGTGDPRLMAGGISEAMITTQVGLAVAIPIMMTASFLGARVRNISRDMEEKGITLMGALLRVGTQA